VLRVAGRGAAELFAAEAGGHRWQRVPPNERRGRVHSSTITVAVLPEPSEGELVLRREDLEEEFMRGSGAGGQNRNKRDTAVRLRHVPTGLEVRSEGERTQGRNREIALAMLRAKVAEAERDAHGGARDDDRRRQVGSGQRGDKRRTVRAQDEQVVDHADGRTWRLRDYVRGTW
jgi:peptide chain release factor 1